MKKIAKSTISILLVLVLSFSVVLQTTAAASKCDCGEEPIVYVAALGSATLYKDAGTADEKVIFRPETDAYIELIAKLIVPLVSLVFTKDYDAFIDAVIPAAMGIFGSLANAPDGTSTPDVTTKEELPTDPQHGLDYSYYYGYDFRADPVASAEGLDAFIDRVIEITGHDKVRLKASSMGGVVTMAYLEKYGTEKIKSIIFQCCPIKGTALAGDLYCGNLVIEEEAVYRYGMYDLPLLVDGVGGKILTTLVDILYKTGVLGMLIDVIDEVLVNCRDRVYDEMLIPVFKANCGLWSFVPDEYYENAKRFMLGALYDEETAKLVERIDYYHYNVQNRADEILNSVVDSGIPVMILAAYNVQRTPIISTWKNDSDETVDTKYASVGATVALLGETLGDKYVQKVNDGHNHISPDNKIDASTCALPENTWFVKDMLHCTTHDGHGGLYNWFFENDDSAEMLTVHSNPAYPQFLQNNISEQTLTPLK
ncbi:MAG: hypothetical protein IJA02_05990 [Clostridia bacterium]|nr:hypothetical protein [Clostridia bacterium]